MVRPRPLSIRGPLIATIPSVSTNLNYSSQIFISQINGQAVDVVYQLLGGWASANGGAFATYDSFAGFEALGSGLTNWAGQAVATYAGANLLAGDVHAEYR